jgi:hypothetical protein
MHSSRRSIAAVAAPMTVGAALFTAGGGWLHLREWLVTYRHVPAAAPGSALVRIGFPLNATISAALAVALVASAFWLHRFFPVAVGAAMLFQIGSLTTLILSRTGKVFGWSEPIWTRGANQIRAVEIGAVVCLAAVIAIGGLLRTGTEHPAPDTVS